MSKEIWKPITGYEGLYEVSNLGRVKSLRAKKVMQHYVNSNNYLGVYLCVGGKKKWFTIHRLVAEAFCEKPTGKNVVDHIDGNRHNNTSDNLRWCTQIENIYYGRQIRPVIRTDGNEEVYYRSMQDTQADGFSPTRVCDCCRGRMKSHKGYKWRYADESAQATGA